MILLLISFVAGVLTVLAPCILPLLPVIVGGTLAGGGTGAFNYKKALTIVGALGASVIIFTLLLKASTLLISIPASVWTWLSGLIIIFFGLVTIFPSWWESAWLAKFNARSNQLLGRGERRQSWWGDVLVGAALGPVFSTCSPTYFIVLATVLPVSPLLGLTYLLAYVVGLSLSLLLVAAVGQKLMDQLGLAADPRGWFKRTLGVLFLVVGVAIIAGWDKQLQLSILESGFFDVTQIEQHLLEQREATPPVPVSDSGSTIATTTATTTAIATPVTKPTAPATPIAVKPGKKVWPAPELSTIDGYINTGGQPITLASLRGQVVLLDIWTYSCINCQRTLPYLKDWYAKYHSQGLEIVGLHTPEFAFEHVLANVEQAVKDFGLTYPVVLDNDYSTWRALGNQFWPRKYLIDTEGNIIYDHIGEGGYAEMEAAIQAALKARATKLGLSTTLPTTGSVPTDAVSVGPVSSPETYFGAGRGHAILELPDTPEPNQLYLGGQWSLQPEYAENTAADATILFAYQAKNVYMAAGAPTGVTVEIYQDDKLVKKLKIKDEKLYTLIEGADYQPHVLKIKVPKAGLRAFTFTFG